MIRMGTVISVNDSGQIEFKFLDSLGGGTTNYISMPYAGFNYGMYIKPGEGDVIVVEDLPERGLTVLLAYIPQNYANVPKNLKVGEFLFISKSQAVLYMPNDGNVYLQDTFNQGLILDAVNGKVELNGMQFLGNWGDFKIYSGDVSRLNLTYDEQEFSLTSDGLVELYISKGVRDSAGVEMEVDGLVYLYLKVGNEFELYIDKEGTIKIDGSRFIGNFSALSEITGNLQLLGNLNIGESGDKLLKSSFISDAFNKHTHTTIAVGSLTSIPIPIVKTLYETNKLESE